MKIAHLGAQGRLGSEIQAVLKEQNISSFELRRQDIETGASLLNAIREPVVVLDSSLPEGTETLCKSLQAANSSARNLIRGVVIGVTGHSVPQLAQIEKTATHFPICLVSNFSRGIFLFEQLLAAKTESGKSVADLARSLGFDFAMVETHHTKKKDAPSGTAKTLAAACGLDSSRISSLRVGEVIGEHEIVFSAEAEQLRLTHVAHSRRLFALGAVHLTHQLFTRHLTPGLLSRSDFES